jgi:hypothetical protein
MGGGGGVSTLWGKYVATVEIVEKPDPDNIIWLEHLTPN